MTASALSPKSSHTLPVREERNPQEDKKITYNLDDYLLLFPPSKQIMEFVDRFFKPIHHDKDLPKATLFFKQIIVENEPIFSKLSTQEKVDLLFEKYRKMLISFIEESQEFIIPLSKLQAGIPGITTIHSSIRKLVESEISNFHHGFAEFAICDALEAHIKDVAISRGTTTISYMLEHLAVSSKAYQLFQAVIGR